MSHARTFKELVVWQKAHQLVLLVYRITKKFPQDEKFGLVSQMRRAAVSVASNIVEGFRRRTIRDSISFYNKSDASLEELKYQLFLSRDLNYLTGVDFSSVQSLCEEVSKLLFRWTESHKIKLHD